MNQERILIIDDESAIRSSLQGILEDEGYAVQTAASGEEGLEILFKGNFGLVLLDIWLPEMNGLDVLTEIQNRDEKPAVVVISGHGTVETAVKAVKSVCDTVGSLSIQFHDDQVRRTINWYLRARGGQKELLPETLSPASPKPVAPNEKDFPPWQK